MLQSRHILQDFGGALDSLRADVLMMASLTDRNLQNAMSCLLDRNAEMCAVTLADEEEIDALEKKVDEQGVHILLRYQPVASDLRQVISAMKLSSNLATEPVLEEASALGPMFVETTTLFRDSVRSYADADVTLARSLRARDREIDEMNRHIADDLTVSMGRHPDRIPEYLHLVFIARYLERVGDHAKNIGEDAVYAAEAEDIRHPKNAFTR
jgi:phosphate transport system protein